MKLFGSSRSGSRLAENRAKIQAAIAAGEYEGYEAAPQKRRNPLKRLAIFLAVVLFIEGCYFVCVYSDNAFISKWRSIYIETAMDTLNHKWLATSIIPADIIEEVQSRRQENIFANVGLESSWGKEETGNPETTPDATDEPSDSDGPIHIDADVNEIGAETLEQREARLKEEFFELFYEVDRDSLDAWIEDHPETIADGWDKLYVNEAGTDDDGTDIETIHGDQVLAIDAVNQVLLVRVKGTGYIGVLAIAKDPARLSVQPSSQLGTTGETVNVIAEANNGVLAMTGGGFDDPGGNGNGGKPAGFVMSDGEVLNPNHCPYGYKRIELHENNLFYINDVGSKVSENCTDSVEFGPALVIDGRIVVDANCGYTGIHPRAAIGQSEKYEIMMIVIEGRLPLRSLGTDVIEVAKHLKTYGCMQAMNLDGGTSAVMYFDGEMVNVCSNTALPYGRTLPNAFVYSRANEE